MTGPLDLAGDAVATVQDMLQQELDLANSTITELQAASSAELAGWTARRDNAVAGLAELAAFQQSRK